ncbi:hypothetical protein KR009_010673 [Drosophila setifemur]|nr:hypothetical protein KR009_010673 [Drosophila setifemur]
MAGNRRSSQLQLFLLTSLLASVFASLPEDTAGAGAGGGGAGVGGGEARWNALGFTPGQRVLAAVPPSERVSFLLYQLALAINSGVGGGGGGFQEVEEVVEQVVENQEHYQAEYPDPNWLAAMANEFQNVPIYESFPADLQHWLTDSYGISATDVYWNNWQKRFGRSRGRSTTRGQLICTTDGQCYEVDKIVTACCPF